ncbi:MAG: hypothetical protein QM770_08770 [Tepidisphaeraceae bacterium]
MKTHSFGSRDRLFVILLVVLALVLFGRMAGYEFTQWDDFGTIHHNSRMNPPTWQGTIVYYWTTFEQGLYVPITWTVWAGLAMIARVETPDQVGATLNPWLFHGINILLHALNSALVYRLIRTIKPDSPAWAIFIATIVFVVHPVQVESVAWVSGMKDVLCWMLAVSALNVYLDASIESLDPTRSVASRARFWGATVLFVLACLSKPTAMVLPAVAWLIDTTVVRRSQRMVWLRLVPWLAISLVTAIVARQAQFVEHVAGAPSGRGRSLSRIALRSTSARCSGPRNSRSTTGDRRSC